MRRSCTALLLANCALAFAQTGLPQLPSSGSSIGAFVPERWLAIDTAFGDLNKDQRDDAVLVLQCRDTLLGDTMGMGSESSPAPPRTLAVLFGTVDGYQLGLQNDRFILRSNEGGYFDPFEGVHVEDGKLLLYFYGGSGWRFSRTYTFRYSNTGFELIGAEAISYDSPTGDGVARSLDFLAHRMQVRTGNVTQHEEGDKTLDQELPPWPLRTFDTFVRRFSWWIDPALTL